MNVGHKLSYIQPRNNMKLSIQTLVGMILILKSYFWNLYGFYVANIQPSSTILNGFIHKSWAYYRIDKVIMLKNSVVLVGFDLIEIRDQVL